MSAVLKAGAAYGASQADWAHFDLMLGLTADLLPIVSNPNAPISPHSKVEGLGKTPTEYNRLGKVRGMAEWTKKVSTAAEIATWSRNPDYGIGLQARVVRALDVDIADAQLASEAQAFIAARVGALPCRMRSNSAKFLLAFEMAGECRKKEIRTGPDSKIEFLAGGQQFVAVGTHPSGARYEWRDGLPEAFPVLTQAVFDSLWKALADRFDVAPAKPTAGKGAGSHETDIDPAAAVARFNTETLEHLRSALGVNPATGRPWIDPESHGVWISVANNLASMKDTPWEDALRAAWLGWSSYGSTFEDGRKDPAHTWDTCPGDRSDYRAVFNKAEDGGWPNPWSKGAKSDDEYARLQDRSDEGNCNVLIALTEGNFRYVPERQCWLWWDGAAWQVDRYGAIAKAQALRVPQSYQQKASEIAKQARDTALDERERKRLMAAVESLNKWATRCRNQGPTGAMLDHARRDQRVQLGAALLDRQGELLGVANGVVDLRTGDLRQAAREDYVTKRSPFAFNQAAKAPRWQQFVDEVTGLPGADRDSYVRRPRLAEYLQRALGYSLTGSTAEHKMFLAIGGGANGKNVLLDIFQEVAGDYCQTIPPEALAATRHDADSERPTPTAATLAGARAAVSSESKDGQRLDVALIKRHTGGGFMTARLMRENTFRFEITHKLWLMTNHRPALDHLDDAIRGRLHLIPFDRTWNRPGHPEPDPALPEGDKDLMQKLRAEGEGILAWLVAGAVAYHQDGLEPPLEVVSMTREFFKELDPLGRWLDEHDACEPKAGVGTSATDLLDQFNAWLVDGGETDPAARNATAFGIALKNRKVPGKPTNSGKYYGLRRRNSVTGDGL